MVPAALFAGSQPGREDVEQDQGEPVEIGSTDGGGTGRCDRRSPGQGDGQKCPGLVCLVWL